MGEMEKTMLEWYNHKIEKRKRKNNQKNREIDRDKFRMNTTVVLPKWFVDKVRKMKKDKKIDYMASFYEEILDDYLDAVLSVLEGLDNTPTTVNATIPKDKKRKLKTIFGKLGGTLSENMRMAMMLFLLKTGFFNLNPIKLEDNQVFVPGVGIKTLVKK